MSFAQVLLIIQLLAAIFGLVNHALGIRRRIRHIFRNKKKSCMFQS